MSSSSSSAKRDEIRRRKLAGDLAAAYGVAHAYELLRGIIRNVKT